MFSTAHKVTALSITAVLLLAACGQGTQQPSSEPTVAVPQTATATAKPTATPTEQPTASPAVTTAAATPTQAATATATATQAATQVPTQAPTRQPTTAPTQAPPPTTAPPTAPPTEAPTLPPTPTPTPTAATAPTVAPPAGTPSTYVVKGKVTDSSTGAPLPTTCVVLGIPGAFCWAVTDANGNYSIDVGAYFGGAIPPGQAYDLYFIRTGYATDHSSVTFSSATPVTKNFAMHQ